MNNVSHAHADVWQFQNPFAQRPFGIIPMHGASLSPEDSVSLRRFNAFLVRVTKTVVVKDDDLPDDLPLMTVRPANEKGNFWAFIDLDNGERNQAVFKYGRLNDILETMSRPVAKKYKVEYPPPPSR